MAQGTANKDSRSVPPRLNWSIIQRNASIYALSLVDLSATNGPRAQNTSTMVPSNKGGLDVAATTFVFSTSPKSLSMDEPAAVTIVPTPGGQFVEHQGQIYKNITISGTTGLRPNAKQFGIIIPVAGILLPGSNIQSTAGQSSNDNFTGLPQGERTGFDDFIALRNLFRYYWDCKGDPDKAPNTVMVWQNGKEGEYYIVEPMTFRTNRDASSPLTSSYDIQLRTIDKFDPSKLGQRVDPLRAQSNTQLANRRIADIRRTLASSFTTAQALVSSTTNIAKATLNDVLAPVNQILTGLAGVVSAGRQVFDIPQTTIGNVAANATDLANQLSQVPNNSYVALGIANQAIIAANAYHTIARQLLRLQNENSLFSTPVTTTVDTKKQAYNSALTGPPLTGGSPTNLNNVRVASGAASTTINKGEDIKDVALRVLGDKAQWKVLVLLNALQQPYISPAGDGITVLRPTIDPILYPRSPNSPDALVASTTQNIVGTVSPLDRLGRDFMLESRTATAGEVVYDIARDQRGDLARIERAANMEQALVIKIDTEQGELPTHPSFGLRAPIGVKALQQSLINFQINVRATLASDNRISSVLQALTTIVGNVMRVRAVVLVKDFDQPLSVNHAVQR